MKSHSLDTCSLFSLMLIDLLQDSIIDFEYAFIITVAALVTFSTINASIVETVECIPSQLFLLFYRYFVALVFLCENR